MSASELEIKISTAVRLEQLRAMEQQLSKQIVQLRALGSTGTAALKKVEQNLALVRGELGKIGTLSKFNAALGDTMKSIPVVGAAMNVLNGSAAAVGVGIAAATYAATQFRAALNFADQLQDVSEQLGVSSSSLQTLNAHFADAGVKAPQVASLLQKLQDSLSRGAAGDPAMVRGFAALNLSIGELRAMSPDRALETYGAALVRAGNDAAAAAANMDILGRNSGRAVNALKDLASRGLDTVRDSMTASGRVIDDEMVKRLAEANQKLEQLDQRWTIFKATVAAGMVGEIDLATANPDSPDHAARLAEYWKSRGNDQLAANWTKRAAELREQSEMLDPRQEIAKRQAAAAEAVALAEKKRLMDAQAITAELAKQAPEIAKALAAAQYALAAEERKLELLNEQGVAVQQRYEEHLAAARLAGDEAAAQQAEEARSLALLKIEIDRKAVRQSIADAAEKERAERERLVKLEEAAARKRQALEAQALADRIAAGNAQIAAIEDNQHLVRSEKDRLKVELLRQQNAEIAEQILKLKQLDLMDPDGPDPARQSQISGLQGKLVANDSAISAATPRSVEFGATAGAVEYLDSIPNSAQRAQQAVLGLAQSMEQGIGGALRGLIDGTMSWTDALQNIASSIVNEIVNSFVRMAAQWITQQIVMAVFGKALQAAQLAALAPMAMASAAMWMPAATAASIATMGGAAATGSIAARTAVAASVVGFATGGKVTGPGTGTSDSILANLSNGEYVIRAAAARQIGYDNLDAINSGRTPAAAAPLAATGGAGGRGAGVVVNHTYHAGVTRADLAALVPEIERRTIAAVHDRQQRNKI